MLISEQPDVIRLLGDPLRSRIIEILAGGPACTCHLVDDLGVKQPTISNQLRTLREAGLVAAEPCGRFTFYRLLPEAMEATAARLAGLAAQARANVANRRECP